MKYKKTLSNWLTNRFLLIIRNEENFAEKKTFSFNYAKLIVFGIVLLIILFTASFYMVTVALSKWFNPRHAQMEMNRNIILLSSKVDSLAIEVERKDQFIMAFKRLLAGENEAAEDSLAEKTGKKVKPVDLSYVSPIDLQVRKQFESEEYQGGDTYYRRYAENVPDIFFFSPIEGIITSKFNSGIGHYGIDIVAKKNSAVRNIADGTVVLSSWTNDMGHILVIQHKGNIMSVYKHNSVLLKKTGDYVKSGEAIALIGNSGELTTGTHLHFELWFDGSPVNPEYYISF